MFQSRKHYNCKFPNSHISGLCDVMPYNVNNVQIVLILRIVKFQAQDSFSVLVGDTEAPEVCNRLNRDLKVSF